MKTLHPDQRKRTAEKQASRDEDERQLTEGEITPLELKKRNSFFSSLDLSNYEMVAIGSKKIQPRRMAKTNEKGSKN